jgi:hypothetical protein
MAKMYESGSMEGLKLCVQIVDDIYHIYPWGFGELYFINKFGYYFLTLIFCGKDTNWAESVGSLFRIWRAIL